MHNSCDKTQLMEIILIRIKKHKAFLVVNKNWDLLGKCYFTHSHGETTNVLPINLIFVEPTIPICGPKHVKKYEKRISKLYFSGLGALCAH